MKNPKIWRSDFLKRSNDEPVYDVEFDKELIKQSIAKQYHILPSEQDELHYSDWALLVSGLMDDTPLGRVVEVRCETDKERIKAFGAGEMRIRREWNEFLANKKREDPEKAKADILELEKMLAEMFS